MHHDPWNDESKGSDEPTVKFLPRTPSAPLKSAAPPPLPLPVQPTARPWWFPLAMVSIPCGSLLLSILLFVVSQNGDGAVLRSLSENSAILAAKTAESRPITICIAANKCPGSGEVTQPQQPALVPEQYGATVSYQPPPPPKRWASRWGLYPLEQVRAGYQACQQSGWSASWPEAGLTCTDLAKDVQDGLIVLW